MNILKKLFNLNGCKHEVVAKPKLLNFYIDADQTITKLINRNNGKNPLYDLSWERDLLANAIKEELEYKIDFDNPLENPQDTESKRLCGEEIEVCPSNSFSYLATHLSLDTSYDDPFGAFQLVGTYEPGTKIEVYQVFNGSDDPEIQQDNVQNILDWYNPYEKYNKRTDSVIYTDLEDEDGNLKNIFFANLYYLRGASNFIINDGTQEGLTIKNSYKIRVCARKGKDKSEDIELLIRPVNESDIGRYSGGALVEMLKGSNSAVNSLTPIISSSWNGVTINKATVMYIKGN